MRYALYFVPSEASQLTRRAAQWLGRDIFGNRPDPLGSIGVLPPEAIYAMTQSARRYGFHATLKAPFRLADGCSETDLLSAFDEFVSRAMPVVVPEMMVGMLGDFFAVVPQQRCEALDKFAGDVVAAFDRFRSRLTEDDIARRRPERLSAEELNNLRTWGYPYVFDSFRFHMTLTDRVSPELRDAFAEALGTQIAPVLPRPFPVDALALCVEPQAGEPFIVRAYARLGQASERRSA